MPLLTHFAWLSALPNYRMFVIAIIGMIVVAGQNYYYSRAAAGLTSKLRSLCFRAILRQDSTFLLRLSFWEFLLTCLLVAWFDQDRNSTGGLVSVLADNPTKISGLAGITLGACVSCHSNCAVEISYLGYYIASYKARRRSSEDALLVWSTGQSLLPLVSVRRIFRTTLAISEPHAFD